MPLSSTSMQAYGYIRSTSAPPPGLNDLVSGILSSLKTRYSFRNKTILNQPIHY